MHTVDIDVTTHRVATLYGRVLSLPDVRPEDDFFTLGGTSLSALDLLDLVHQEFGLRVPVRAFYQATSVRDLAGEVHALGTKG